MEYGLVKKNQKSKNYEGIGILTKWFKQLKIDNINELNNIINRFAINQFHYKYILCMFYNRPNIVSYINRTMNDMYRMYKISTSDYILSLMYIAKMNGYNYKNFNYLNQNEYKDSERDEIMEFFKEYYELVFHRYLNAAELRDLYKLYLNNVITMEDIYYSDKFIHNDTTELKLKYNNNSFINKEVDNNPLIIKEYKTIDVSVNSIIEEEKNRSTETQELITRLNNVKFSNCKNCTICSSKFLPLYTNSDSLKDLDFLIIQMQPSIEDGKFNMICNPNTKLGKYVSNMIEKWAPNSKFLFTNIINCTKSDKYTFDDEEILKQVNMCSKIRNEIINSCLYKRLIIIGTDTCKYFINKDCNLEVGKVYNDLNCCIVQNPVGLRSASTIAKCEQTWKVALTFNQDNTINEPNSEEIIEEEIDPFVSDKIEFIDDYDNNYEELAPNLDINNSNDSINEDYNLNNDDDNSSLFNEFLNNQDLPKESVKLTELTLVDVQELINTNEVLYVFVDLDGKKHYIKKPYKITCYGTMESDFKKCLAFNPNIDFSVTFNKEQKLALNKMLNSQLKDLKRINIR